MLRLWLVMLLARFLRVPVDVNHSFWMNGKTLGDYIHDKAP